MPLGDDPNDTGQKPVQQTTFIPTISAQESKKKSVREGRTSMIVGGIFFILGVLATLGSDFEVLWWGAILFGAIMFFTGLVQHSKANRNK